MDHPATEAALPPTAEEPLPPPVRPPAVPKADSFSHFMRSLLQASALFVIGFAIPHLDLLQHVAGWLRGSTVNDLAHALGPPDWPALAVFLAYGILVVVVGFAVQRRLYGERSLSRGAFLLLAGATAIAAPLASSALQRLLS